MPMIFVFFLLLSLSSGVTFSQPPNQPPPSLPPSRDERGALDLASSLSSSSLLQVQDSRIPAVFQSDVLEEELGEQRVVEDSSGSEDSSEGEGDHSEDGIGDAEGLRDLHSGSSIRSFRLMCDRSVDSPLCFTGDTPRCSPSVETPFRRTRSEPALVGLEEASESSLSPLSLGAPSSLWSINYYCDSPRSMRRRRRRERLDIHPEDRELCSCRIRRHDGLCYEMMEVAGLCVVASGLVVAVGGGLSPLSLLSQWMGRGGKEEEVPQGGAEGGRVSNSNLETRLLRFRTVLGGSPSIDLGQLRELLWSGCPDGDAVVRAQAWKLILGYLPGTRADQGPCLIARRGAYWEMVQDLKPLLDMPRGGEGARLVESDPPSASSEEAISKERKVQLFQIRKDVPRTVGLGSVPSLIDERLQRMVERVLLVWAEKHPIAGYVQGINDILCPFLICLLQEATALRRIEEARGGKGGSVKGNLYEVSVEDIDVKKLPTSVLDDIEADAYWMLSKLLGDIQDHYCPGQPGIRRMASRLKELLARVAQDLWQHLEMECIDLFQVSFRWMNCLFLREFPLPCVLRIWDTYLAEAALTPDGRSLNAGDDDRSFTMFHLYTCAAILTHFKKELLEMDFEGISLFFQRMPTMDFDLPATEMLLAEAYVTKTLFHHAPQHLVSGGRERGEREGGKELENLESAENVFS